MWNRFIAKYGSLYYDLGQELQGEITFIQSSASIITTQYSLVKKGYYKVGKVTYYKVGESLLQSLAGITKWDNFVTKWAGSTKHSNC